MSDKEELEQKDVKKILQMKKHSDPMDFGDIIITLFKVATAIGILILVGLGVLIGIILKR